MRARFFLPSFLPSSAAAPGRFVLGKGSKWPVLKRGEGEDDGLNDPLDALARDKEDSRTVLKTEKKSKVLLHKILFLVMSDHQ